MDTLPLSEVRSTLSPVVERVETTHSSTWSWGAGAGSTYSAPLQLARPIPHSSTTSTLK